MDPQEFIDQFYLALLDKGWKLQEIDQMDMIYYLRLIKRNITTEQIYIDEVL
ncbi:MAG: hypothetical protein ACOX2Q_05180 [Dehalobacterium sp.]